MGRIKNKTVKRAAREIIEKYYGKLTNDFYLNKKIVEQVADAQTKKIRNKIAGYTTLLVKRIHKGPVKGISLKVQEEQRERNLDVIPEKSQVNISNSEFAVTQETQKMLEQNQLFAKLKDFLKVQEPQRKERVDRNKKKEHKHPKKEAQSLLV
jgi:small subunit ribosomal protein S17e